ncbi:hypothetical protein L7F22_034208 [Adiantum nelumboides]|nr:hypothetical protein [Adiantum nelumboides]
MRTSKERHNLQNKIKRWEEQMSGRGRGSKTTAASTRSSLKTKGTSVPLSSVPTGGCLVQLAEEDSRALAKIKHIAEGRLQDYKSRLEGAKKPVEDQVRELHRVEGAQSSNTLAIKLQTEIDCMQDPVARQRLVDLIGQFLSTTRENRAELEAKVARAKSVLDCMVMYYNQESKKRGICMRCTRSSGFLDEGSIGSLAQSYPVKNPRGGAIASRGVPGKKKVCLDTIDHCKPTSTAEFVPNVPNADDVLVVHTDVDRAKLEKGTLPIPTTVESGIDAIVDACTNAIADATVVDACTNDIVDALEVDASTDAAVDGNVNDGGTESIVCAVIDAILDAIEAMDAIADATVVDARTNDIVDAMEVDASTNAATDGNVNDGGTKSIVRAVIDALLDAVEAMGKDATVKDTRGMGEEVLIEREVGTCEAVGASDVTVQAEVVCPSVATVEDTRGMGEEVLIKREAGTCEAVGASDVTTQAKVVCPSDATVEDTRGRGEEVLIKREARTCEAVGASDVIAQAEVVFPSDAADDIVDAEEAKGTDADAEDMRGLGEEDPTKRVPGIGSAVGIDDVVAFADTAETGDRAVQSREAMGEAVVAATDMKEANTHISIEACIEQNNAAGKGTEVPTDRVAQSKEAMEKIQMK